MKHVIVCGYARDLTQTCFDYVEKNKEQVFRFYTKNYIGIAELKNGDEVWIIPSSIYKNWCKGRTYMIDGKKYHSGYPCTDK